jgi:electron transport complex protein RnfE
MRGNLFINILRFSPTLTLLLGLCPSLAITTSVLNALGMGVAFTFVLIFSNIFVSALRRWIPNEIRIPLFIIIAVTFVSITDMVMAGFTPDLYKALGIFIPLIVVNCIILGRAEAYAYTHTVWESFIDAVYNGVGFTFGLALLAGIREVIGNGTFLNMPIPGSYQPMLIFILPPGGFLLIGVLLAIMNLDKQKA